MNKTLRNMLLDTNNPLSVNTQIVLCFIPYVFYNLGSLHEKKGSKLRAADGLFFFKQSLQTVTYWPH